MLRRYSSSITCISFGMLFCVSAFAVFPENISKLRSLNLDSDISGTIPLDTIPDVPLDLPDASFTRINFGREGLRQEIKTTIRETFGQGKVLLFTMPGAFTPTCAGLHLPSITRNLAGFSERGISKIGIVTTDTPDTLTEWLKQSYLLQEDIVGVADVYRTFLGKVGLLRDAARLGVSGKRSMIYIKNGKIMAIKVEEEAGQCNISSGEKALETIDAIELELQEALELQRNSLKLFAT